MLTAQTSLHIAPSLFSNHVLFWLRSFLPGFFLPSYILQALVQKVILERIFHWPPCHPLFNALWHLLLSEIILFDYISTHLQKKNTSVLRLEYNFLEVRDFVLFTALSPALEWYIVLLFKLEYKYSKSDINIDSLKRNSPPIQLLYVFFPKIDRLESPSLRFFANSPLTIVSILLLKGKDYFLPILI